MVRKIHPLAERGSTKTAAPKTFSNTFLHAYIRITQNVIDALVRCEWPAGKIYSMNYYVSQGLDGPFDKYWHQEAGKATPQE